MGNLIFNNPGARATLESITHPYITDSVLHRISSLSFNDFIIIENAILFESEQYKMMDGFIIVNVEPSVQKNATNKKE